MWVIAHKSLAVEYYELNFVFRKMFSEGCGKLKLVASENSGLKES